MIALKGLTFEQVCDALTIKLHDAPVVRVGEWQAQKDVPQADTIEVEDVSFEIAITNDLARDIRPNLPWAEEHFQERVSGIPWNPPPSHVRWPFAQQDNAQHRTYERFSHTYPERFWPTRNEHGQVFDPDRMGIRFRYGDLADLVEVLRRNSGTRQAYLPIWFPEDLAAAVENARVPCTLGYHFLIRREKLKIVYYIRSCDFYRHFRDDVYMAARLAQWVANEVGVDASKLVMHISSLHIFVPEKGKIDQEAHQIIARNMINVYH